MIYQEKHYDSFSKLFPSFPDAHTVVLWAFDETEYPHVTLTDASLNEFDLTIMNGGRLIPGRFGQALRVAPGDDPVVAYAGAKGGYSPMRDRAHDGEPMGLWGPTIAPGTLMKMLKDGQWTMEFWLKFEARPDDRVVILDLGDAFQRGFSLELLDGGQRFLITNAYGGFSAVCESNADLLLSWGWRHVTFTYEAGTMRHFINGKLQSEATASTVPQQPLAELISFKDRRDHFQEAGWSWQRPDEWRREHRFNVALGEDRQGQGRMDGVLDEFRISDVVRYASDFPPPASLTYNYGANAPEVAVANGEPLLFTNWPVNPGHRDLGSRKHVFIDGLLFESLENADIVCNPPKDRQELNIHPGKSSWRPTVMDVDGKVYMYLPEGYSSREGLTHLCVSEDGVNFQTPDLDTYEEYPDCVLANVPSYGTFFHDLNPSTPPWAKYKYTAWSSNRGMYLYVSPDGIHWRRNQSAMLPIVSGGGVESFWDDQLGLYRTYVRRDTSTNTREGPAAGASRRLCMFETDEVTKVWPFHRLRHPYFKGNPFPALTGEGPVVFDATPAGQVYRSRAIKYPWAPDTYLAFVWRFNAHDQTRRIDLGTSRDGGTLWHFFAPETWYVEPGDVAEVLSIYGLIRRDDEIWHYVDYGGAHGGGDAKRVYARFTQRLDGFTSLDTETRTGTATSRPITFKGERLVLNITATGETRVEISNEKGKPIPGFALTDCNPIQSDNVRHLVTWNGKEDVSSLSGKVVRLKFQMNNTKLYAMQFVK